MLVQGLKGSYIIQSPRSPPKIQEIAFQNAGFCWIPWLCLPEMSSAAVPRPHGFLNFKQYVQYIKAFSTTFMWLLVDFFIGEKYIFTSTSPD